MNKTQIFLKKNSPMILTVIGAGGVVATSVLSVKATPKAINLLNEAREAKGEELTTIEKIKVAWKPYIPAVLTGVSTIVCIFGVNHLNTKSQASLMSAYALLDQSFKDYRDKVNDVYGEDADSNVRNEIVKSNYDEHMSIDPDSEMFFDFYSMTFFDSTMDHIKDVERTFMNILNSHGVVFVNDYLDLLGLDHTPLGNQKGWSLLSANDVYGYPDVQFKYDTVTMSNGQKCTNIILTVEPDFIY